MDEWADGWMSGLGARHMPLAEGTLAGVSVSPPPPILKDWRARVCIGK